MFMAVFTSSFSKQLIVGDVVTKHWHWWPHWMQRPTPTAVLKVFSPILMLYFFVYSQGLQLILKSDNCARSIEGLSLMKHSYKSFFEQDLFKCYQKCKVDNLCQSINFYKDRNFCQLNNRTQSALVPNLNVCYMDNPCQSSYRFVSRRNQRPPAV